MCKARINLDDLWQHLASHTQTETKGERISASITPDLLRAPQRTSKWNLIIRSMDYSCGLLSRCATIIAATPIPFTNMMVGSQPWLEHTGSTDQECDGGIEQVPVCFESSWFHKRCCRNVYGIREGDQRGNWTLTSMHACYLIQNSSILQQMAFFHASTLFIKSAVFHLSMIAVQLIHFPASQGSRRSSQRNYTPCGEHQSPSWPAEKARGSPNIRWIVWYYQRVPRPDGKSGDSHSEVAEKLDV